MECLKPLKFGVTCVSCLSSVLSEIHCIHNIHYDQIQMSTLSLELLLKQTQLVCKIGYEIL